jgi:hypothetical protein
MSDDYEDFGIIWRDVTRLAWTLRPGRDEIAKAIGGLIRDGYAYAYVLQATSQPPSPVKLESSDVEDLWYYATPKGLEQSKDETHWRELDSKIRSELPEWHLEIRNLHGDLLFEWDRRHGVLNLKDVDLREANMRELDLTGITLDGNNMAGADLRHARLYWAALFNVNLEGANLESANLQGTSLNGINFRRANLRNANIGVDDFGWSSFIFAVDSREADLTGVILKRAQADSDTKFPEGFDTAAHGMGDRYTWQTPAPP